MPIPAIIGAVGVAANLIGGKKASNAANKAAAQQQAAAQQAQQFNERVYTDQQRALNPYQNAGSDALARLTAQHWGTPYQPPTAQPMPAAYQAPAAPVSTGVLGRLDQAMRGANGTPPTSLAAMQGQQTPQGGGLVKVQAPDGSIEMHPLAIAQQFVAHGGRIVG